MLYEYVCYVRKSSIFLDDSGKISLMGWDVYENPLQAKLKINNLIWKKCPKMYFHDKKFRFLHNTALSLIVSREE